MFYNKTLWKRLLCKHRHAVERSRSSRLICTGMRKEITRMMYCPECGREWKETEYV